MDPDGEHQPLEPVRAWPSRETLAEFTDQPVGTVKSQLDTLRAKGWIRRDKGSTMTLAWREPGRFEYGDPARPGCGGLKDQPRRLKQGPGDISAVPADTSTPPVEISTPDRLIRPPLSSNHHSNSSSNNVGDARDATPAPQGIPAQLAELRARNRAAAREHQAATTLPTELHRRLRNHANGAWSVELRNVRWVESLTEAMSSLGLDADRRTRAPAP
jgi:DNA-binding transcriptional MocR family regulator